MSEVIDIDAMLAAKSGGEQQKQPVTDNPVETPAVDDEPKNEEPSNEEPVKEEPKEEGVETPESEEPKNEEEPSNEEPVVEKPTNEPAEIDLDEYVVEVDGKDLTVNEIIEERDALAKRIAEVEKDEFLMRFIAHRQAGGDPKEFLESQTVDWDKEDNVSVLKRQFFKEYSDIDLATRELMFEKELKSKYNIDPNASPEDVDTESRDYKIGQAILKRDAEKARGIFKEEQKKFAIPEKQATAQEPQKFDQAAYKKQIEEDESIAKFSSDKLLKLEVKNEEGNHYGYEVEDPSSIIEMMSDDRKFWQSFFSKDGKLDRAKQAKVYAFAADPEKFEQNLIAIGRTLGTEKVLKEKRNTDGVNNKGSKSPAGGEENFSQGFLKAAKQQKKS